MWLARNAPPAELEEGEGKVPDAVAEAEPLAAREGDDVDVDAEELIAERAAHAKGCTKAMSAGKVAAPKPRMYSRE